MVTEAATLKDVWFIIAFGLVPIGLYVVVRMGLIKSWYILAPLPGLLSGSMVYGALFWGLGFIAIALDAMLPAENVDIAGWRGFIVILLFALSGFVLMAWQPSWIKPRWVRWIEREYGYCLDILIEEARAMGRWNWEARVRTQADLERWVEQVIARHQEEVDQRWEKERQYRLAPKTPAAFRRGGFEREDWEVPDVPEHRQAQEEARLKKIERDFRRGEQ
jgi:hypothetical protein